MNVNSTSYYKSLKGISIMAEVLSEMSEKYLPYVVNEGERKKLIAALAHVMDLASEVSIKLTDDKDMREFMQSLRDVTPEDMEKYANSKGFE